MSNMALYIGRCILPACRSPKVKSRTKHTIHPIHCCHRLRMFKALKHFIENLVELRAKDIFKKLILRGWSGADGLCAAPGRLTRRIL